VNSPLSRRLGDKPSIGVVVNNRLTVEMTKQIRGAIDLDAEILILGSFDELTDEELRALDQGEESLFFEQLGDGTIVRISDAVVEEYCIAAALTLLERGVESTFVYCSLPFPRTKEFGVINPYDVIISAANLVASGSTVGIIVPLEEELSDRNMKPWREIGMPIVSAYAPALRPGTVEETIVPKHIKQKPDKFLAQTAEKLVANGADLILLECMDFTPKQRDLVIKSTGKPTLLPIDLTCGLLASVLGCRRLGS